MFNIIFYRKSLIRTHFTVLNELDGLSRDAAVQKYGSVAHAVHVREGAATALSYVRGSRYSGLKCVTSQGSVLSSATFTAEIDLYQVVKLGILN